MEEDKNKGQSKQNYFALGEVFKYYFRKKDPNQKTNINLRMMHGVNKIAIVMFLAAIIYFIIKKVFFQ